MHTDSNIAKHLIVGLIYPAVLGTIIYQLLETFGNHFIKGDSIKILEGTWDIVLLKVVLLITILTFYSCDFLYTTYTSKFRTFYFCLDLIILIGLFTTFKSSNYDIAQMPQMDKILFCFALFMALYFWWDFSELFHKDNEGKTEELKFYKKMVWWEIISFVAFVILYFTAPIFISTLAIVLSTSICFNFSKT
jgi:hypothetical protein